MAILAEGANVEVSPVGNDSTLTVSNPGGYARVEIPVGTTVWEGGVAMRAFDVRGQTAKITAITRGVEYFMTEDPVSAIDVGIVEADQLLLSKTNTTGNGAQTINKPAGTVNFAAEAESLVVTNSLVTANSIILATVGTDDATMTSVTAVAAAGSFTLHANAAATGVTRVNWAVIN